MGDNMDNNPSRDLRPTDPAYEVSLESRLLRLRHFYFDEIPRKLIEKAKHLTEQLND
jgi:hypothetical protein